MGTSFGRKRIALMVIDGQNDFLDPKGALYVAGADKEALKLVAMLDRLGGGVNHKIDSIDATVDSHHDYDIAHPIFWKDASGNHPNPFTIISAADVKTHKWTPCVESHRKRAVEYVEKLEKRGRNPLCIWPPHCLIGTWGQNIYPPLMEAFRRWIPKAKPNPWINFVTKGANPFTEHYSGLEADVPDDFDPSTKLNVDLIQQVDKADVVAWAGWAGSHCLKWTMSDAVNFFGAGENAFIKKSVILTDCSAAVGDPPGTTMFTDWRNDFLNEMQNRGATLTTSDAFLA